MRISIRVSYDIPEAAEANEVDAERYPEFALVQTRRLAPVAPMLVSGALHLALFFLLPPITSYFPALPENPRLALLAEAKRNGSVVIYLPRQEQTKKPRLILAERRRAPGAAPTGSRQLPPSRPQAEPAQSGEQSVTALLLRPGRTFEQAARMIPLPSFSVWSGSQPQEAERPLRPGRKQFVAPPGRTPALPPALDAPNPETAIGAVAVARFRASGRGPVLSSTTVSPFSAPAPPVVLEEPQADAPSSPGEGDLAAAISISNLPRGDRQVVRLPSASQVMLGGVSGGASGAATGGSRNGQRGSDDTAAASRSASEGGTTGEGLARRGGAAEGAGKERGTISFAVPAYGGSVQVNQRPGGIRVLSYPANGDFDVIIQEAQLPGEIAGTTPLLSRKPVYTVYLNVGERREWILQYCLVASGPVEGGGGMVVSLGPEPAVRAPFIQTATIPPSSATKPGPYLLFHGILTQTGRFEQVRPVGTATEEHNVLAASFDAWRFRPVLRDDKPAAAEVVLVVPPRTSESAINLR